MSGAAGPPAAGTHDSVAWRELGSASRGQRPLEVMEWIAAVMVATLGPAAWSWRVVGHGWWTVMAVGMIGVSLVRWCRGRASSVAVSIVATGVLAGVVVGWQVGRLAGAWVSAAMIVGVFAAERAAAPAAVLSVVSAVAVLTDRPNWVVAGAVVGSVVAPTLIDAGGARVASAVDGFAARVGRVISTVLFGTLSVPMVLMPFVAGRVARRQRFGSTGRWSRPPPGRGSAASVWANDRPGRVSLVRGVVRVASVVSVVAVLATTFGGDASEQITGFVLSGAPRASGSTASSQPPAPPEPPVVLREPVPPGTTEQWTPVGGTPAAMADDPYWSSPEYKDAVGSILNQLTVWRHENPYRFLDVSSEYINVRDGIRTSWSPPPCSCRRIKVWIYGGSTTWGIDQRDDHTIPSELARVAFEHGLTVDVENRGLTAVSHWLEAERFAWDLTTGERPDLVIFYDGVNDIWFANGDTRIRRTNEAPTNPSLISLWDAALARTANATPEPRADSRLVDMTDAPAGPQRQALDIMQRYDHARRMSGSTAAEYGVAVKYIWQPSRYNRPLVPAEPHSGEDQENTMRLQAQLTAANVSPDVINLSDAFDDTPGPIFTDDVHHNERGARVMGESIFEAIEPDLVELAG